MRHRASNLSRFPVDRYVVIGNPIAHSLSPEIHARFAESTGQRLRYERMLVPQGNFIVDVKRFFDEGGRGANVTLPFKQEAFAFAGIRSARAELAGAANFLALRDGIVEADNTDGAGLVADLVRNHRIAIAGRRVLLVGAGGAARGVLAPLLALAPETVVVANRTEARAKDLARRFEALGRIEATALATLADEGFDVVINATSSSVHGDALQLPRRVLQRAFAYDMAYGPAARPFLAMASAAGARAADGLGMLVEQAAESFFLWRGVRPETAAVLHGLRARTP